MSYKKIIYFPFLLALLLGFSGLSMADDFAGIQTAKVVWNVTTGDEKVFLDRMDLIQQTADSLKKRGIKPEFVVIIHGHAAKFVAKDLKGTKFAKDKLPKLQQAHSSLASLTHNGVPVEVCAIALKRAKIKHSNVRDFAVIQENVFENLIVLQNKGYAYMAVN
jgi:intracellular sulfur oxidation DsrE/DsrF family protein